ncbi:M23 family metallopeptidase [Desulfobacterota bacterium AH_259_B03_O07]|nr:M23 family metallopeptidase [Desulfobacterota bacterium AH_259_B03_O07]
MSKGRSFLYYIIIVLLVAGVIYIYPEIEWHSPEVHVKLDSEYIGLRPFDIEVKDKGKGLKKISISLIDEQGETTLVTKDYLTPVKEDKITVELDPKKLGIKGGPAELIIVAEDRSRLKLFFGNRTKISKKVKLDLTAPKAELISTEHRLNHGGSGLVIYKASDDTSKSGAMAGGYFFPGYKGYFKNPNVYMSFFAYPFDLSSDQGLSVVAEDEAGNSKIIDVPYKLKDIRYRKSNVDVSEKFIERKMSPLLDRDDSEAEDLKNVFLKVNRDLRKENNQQIREIGGKSSAQIIWNGAFHQLSNSKVESNFADDRTYYYENQPIDQQYHLGYDLAVTKRYPVEVANDGVVIFVGDLGIYGNTIIVDHGMGITTLYGHLSTTDVNEGDRVKKKQIIAGTGQTGLAAGDHLHYGVYISGIAVRPIEWWDDKWINDNIINKIRQARMEFGTADNAGDQSKDENSKEYPTPQAN